jgi:hypothetical protein
MNSTRQRRKRMRTSMRTLSALAAAAVLAAGGAGVAEAALVEHDGPVLSKESDGQRSFRIEDDESGRAVRFRVNARTQFERIPGGFSGLKRGMVVSVDAKRTDRGLLARFVERDRNN